MRGGIRRWLGGIEETGRVAGKGKEGVCVGEKEVGKERDLKAIMIREKEKVEMGEEIRGEIRFPSST